MAYTLEAFIGKTIHLEHQTSEIPDAKLIYLPQGFVMVLLNRTISHYQNSTTVIKPFYKLTDELFRLGLNLSANGAVGFFEIELFGGYGERSAVLWQNQTVIFGPVMSEDDSTLTNKLFSLLGVQKLSFYDEFDALGLGNYRSTEAWIVNS